LYQSCPTMRTLSLRGNSFVGSTEDWEAFINAIESNNSLEDLAGIPNAATCENAAAIVPRITHALCRNSKAVGRRLIDHQCDSHLKLKLWPFVLEHALQAPYKPSWEVCRNFQWMSRSHPLPKSLYASVPEEEFTSMMQANAAYYILRDSHFIFE
jgi:hypothetical protein